MTPDAVAVVCREQSLSYRELNARANQMGRRLTALGVRPGTLVGLMLERSFEMVVSVLGILKAGAAYLPLDPDAPDERLQFMLRDGQAGVLVTQARFGDRVAEMVVQIVLFNEEERSAQDVANCASSVTAEDLA